jgi:hypothetical protein
VSGAAPTPLQAAWLPVRAALDQARRELDSETFEVFLAMLGALVARWTAERIEHEWDEAA